jgi:hypothetical protein
VTHSTRPLLFCVTALAAHLAPVAAFAFLGACADASGGPAPAETTQPTMPGGGDPNGSSSTTPGATSSGAPAGGGGATPTTPTTKSGTLLFATNAPIAGVAYVSGAQSGVTDAKGAFTYEDGKAVQLSAGAAMLGAPIGAAILSPYQMAGSTTCDDSDGVKTLVALLESLDADGDVTNGITVPGSGMGTRPLPAPDVALRTFITAFDGEAWTAATATATDTFSYGDAIVRGQGLTTDGTSWFFSGTTGLEKTSATFASTTKNAFAIPLLLVAQGSDHIGDIDFWNGKIYAPVEDKSYASPKVVLYDPSSLGAGTVFDIPQNLQTKGVPWIAVDGPRGVAYMAEWDPTPELHVFALSTMAYQRAIPLSTPTGRVQGGKVYKGQLYLTTDDTTKHVYKVHLGSGTIFPILDLNLAGVELEGLVLFARPDGSLLHTLDVTAARTGVELRHHTIAREPLRWKVCP